VAGAAISTVVDAPAASASASGLCDGYAACSVNGFSTYGYPAHAGTSYWEMDPGDECTNYVAFVESSSYRLPAPPYGLGNAGTWGANTRAHGVEVNHVPSVGSVAEWYGDSYGIGPDGHVAVVEQVGPDDSYIVVSQQHIGADIDGFDWERITAGTERELVALAGARRELAERGLRCGRRQRRGSGAALPRRGQLPALHGLANRERPMVGLAQPRRQLAERRFGRRRGRHCRPGDTGVPRRRQLPAVFRHAGRHRSLVGVGRTGGSLADR
jgi:surface antigen